MPTLPSLKVRLVMLVLAVSVAATAVAAGSLIDTRPVRVKAAHWAVANIGNLPDTVEELSSYPAAYRKAAFRVLTPEKRAGIWREHLRNLAQHQHLTTEQRQLINELLALVTPEMYSDTRDQAEVERRFRPLCQRISELFPVEQRRAFSLAGLREVPAEGRLTTWARSFKAFVGATYVANAATEVFHDCDCAEDTWCLDCNTWEGCVFGLVPPCSQGWGCGCLGLETCAGECKTIA
jgi:hypothetical protein